MTHSHDDSHSHVHARELHSQEARMLEQDREDLLALLQMRFGEVPPEWLAEIDRVDKPDTIQRLILVAANAADWKIFVQELRAGDGAFKLVGEYLSPI